MITPKDPLFVPFHLSPKHPLEPLLLLLELLLEAGAGSKDTNNAHTFGLHSKLLSLRQPIIGANVGRTLAAVLWMGWASAVMVRGTPHSSMGQMTAAAAAAVKTFGSLLS